ncbi:putative alpha-1,2-mannosidase, partial [Dysgonomonas sp. PFB1-18]|nr:putative alpha-1,2-mannosidase [Dysgonomonas sp. PF1-14]MDH6341130.1 putative alpha-1,2-mannosidase [Dysgonomonas sp. PF1-16]MDH6382819.1 putative alpha-1,2-mannosidase [Dysgonomonas sp. PFB1-18]MDH6400104.1 putative alpha-1,2-mannosidase [Dysgonomonas sp. PF1-23]
GQPYTKNYLTHEQLINGAVINYKMDNLPNTSRGTQQSDLPYSFSDEVKK